MKTKLITRLRNVWVIHSDKNYEERINSIQDGIINHGWEETFQSAYKASDRSRLITAN